MEPTRWSLLAVTILLPAVGCGVQTGPKPLMPSQFVRSRPGIGPNPIVQPVDRSGALDYGELHAPVIPDEYDNPHPYVPPAIPRVVREAVASTRGAQAVQLSAPATTAATTRPFPGESDQYQVVGTVLANVSGKAIYADKVLASIEHELAAEARKYDDPARFLDAARAAIDARVKELVRNQLYVAAAAKYLSAEDKTLAHQHAQLWRTQQIAAAGGSLELAKQRAIGGGTTLDDAVQERYEATLVQLYYQRRILPRVHVTAEDMRRYYQQRLETEFTQPAAAKFRLIKIDVDRSGGREQAVEKANRVVKELKGGKGFAEVAKEYNDDPFLRDNGGEEGWVRKGEFAQEKVERAVWALQVGEFTDVPIDTDTALYIAQLQERRPGSVQPFDSSAVQQKIEETLRAAQLSALQDKETSDLVRQAVIVEEPNGIETAVDMAMQRYPLWASAR